MIKDKNYFINKLNKLEFASNYSENQIEQVAECFCTLFSNLDKLKLKDNDKYRDLSELEKFLYMYINIINIPKDEEDKNTSHDIIGTILTQKAMCQGYSTIMKFICEELSIPFLYKRTEVNGITSHGNFQVILKDKDNIKHCLHCDPYIDSPSNANDTITFNATLISADDINNYHNKQFPSGGDGDVVLFWNISLDNKSVEEIKETIDSVSTIEKMRIELFGETEENIINSHYVKLREEIIELNKFFSCDIGNMENKNEILLSYQKLKNYYEDNTNEISREEIFSLIRNIYISHYIFVDNNSHQVAAEKSNGLISKQIENTNTKRKEHWTK